MKDILHICKKELREMFRDKRVRSNALYSPMIIMLVVLAMIGFLVETISKPSNQVIHVVNTNNEYAQGLLKSPMKVITLKSVDEGKQMIRDGKAKVVVVFPPTIDAAAPQVKIDMYFDPKEEKAQVARSVVQSTFEKLSDMKLKQLIVSKGLPEEAAQPIKIEPHEILVGKQGSAGALLISLLPYIVVLYAFVGAMGSAGDIIAGEKERLTLETLLISPVKRVDILLGKLLALGTVSLSSSLSATLGVVVASVSGLQIFKKVMENGLGMGVPEFLVVLAVLIPLVAMMASVMLAVSAFAKNIREAQTHLAILSLFITMPAMMSQFIGYTDFGKSLAINLVPVLNTANTIRMAMQGKVEFMPVVITFVVNAVLAAIALTIATRMFRREQILVRI